MKLGSIQFLRALAAILVAYAHSIDLQMRFSHSFQQDFFYLQNFGAFGVDVFFVISGFIISYSGSHYKGWRDGWVFLSHRFRRINLVYYLATLLVIVIRMPAILRHHSVGPTIPVICKSVLLLPVFDRTGWIEPIIFQAWTLAFEWLFYLFFFGIIFSGVRSKARSLVAICIVLLVTGEFFQETRDYRFLFITNPIMLEFLLGVGICWCYRQWMPSKRMAAFLLVLGSAICIYEIIAGFGNISEVGFVLGASPRYSRVVFWGIPAALIVAGAVFLEKSGSLDFTRRNRLIGLLGDSSYSLYLVHGIAYEVLAAVYLRTGFFLQPDLAIFVQLLAAIAGGIMFYKFVEAPLLQRLRKK